MSDALPLASPEPIPATDAPRPDAPSATATARRSPALLATGALLLCGLAWGLWRSVQPVPLPLQGQIDAQEISVSSKVPGRVGRVAVKLGQRVAAGEVVFELDSPEVAAKVTQAQAAQEAARAVAAKAQAGARPEEVAMARGNYERARAAEQIARTTFDRVQAMFDQGVLARQKRDEAEAQWQAAHQQTLAAQAQYELAQKGARSEDRSAAQAQARQVGGVVAEAEVALSETRIKAPAAGEVAKIQIQPGELAPQGFPVITLVNLADVWATLAVREDALADFAPGSEHSAWLPALRARVTFKVASQAVMPDFATWKAARPGGTDLRTFEVRLRPVGEVAAPGLRPGMSVVFDPR